MLYVGNSVHFVQTMVILNIISNVLCLYFDMFGNLFTSLHCRLAI